MAQKALSGCPVCGNRLEATRLHCLACDVSVEGRFATSPLAGLSADQVEFVKVFLAARGNIRLVEKHLGISYPTVRNRLEAVQKAMGLPDLAAGEEERKETLQVLEKLAAGELSVDDAVDSLE